MSNPMTSLGHKLYTGEKSFDFVHNWKRNLSVGVVLCLMAVVLLSVFKLNPGIEFKGGSEFRITNVANTDTGPAIDILEKHANTEQAPQATVLGGNSIRIQTAKIAEAKVDLVREELATAYSVEQDAVTSFFVGPSWGQDITSKALTALIVFLSLVTLLISLYFRTVAMAMGALVALVHDLLITIGVYAATGFEVTPASVIGFLTILGYSLYDTVVVFDKVRENTTHYDADESATFAERVNLAVNQTLVRSVNTSVVALLPVASILFIGAFLLGAGTLKDIALALFIGIIVGTYSSVFVAPGTFVLLRTRDKRIQKHNQVVAEARAKGDEPEVEADSQVPTRVAPGKQREQPKRS